MIELNRNKEIQEERHIKRKRNGGKGRQKLTN